MINRTINTKILQYADQYPVVTITGPRQSGKTTLCKMLFPDIPYVSLEHPEHRQMAQSDPAGFLAQYPNRVVLDEIQRTPNLLSWIQVIVDESPVYGRFIITGSQNFELLNHISQSLAGRTAIARLLPLSLEEINMFQQPESIDQLIYTGCYPGIYDRKLNPTEALSFYFNTYIERDLRLLINVRDLSRFETFLKLCATRCGQVINYSSIGNDCGVNYNTIRNWLSILEASYIIKLLPPYYINPGKRLIKSPKLYFIDTGLAAFLLGIQNCDHVKTHPLRGALFENMIVSDLLKKRFNQGQTDNLYYLRDSKGHEVDVLLDYGPQIDLIEIKSTRTLGSDLFKGLVYFRSLYPQTRHCRLVYGGVQTGTQHNIQIVPWHSITSMTID
jgi:uncharacterized protein